MRRKHLALVMALTILAQLVLTGPVLAADTDTYSPGNVIEDNAMISMNHGEMTAEQLLALPTTYSDATIRDLRAGEVCRPGIDISSYQGTIDWANVAEFGVEFAIIRAGYRGWGTGLLNDDSYMARNIEGALKNGIQVGVYVFSQATNEAEAREEARYLVDRIQGYNVTLPLVMDFEFGWNEGGSAGVLYDAYKDGTLDREKATAVCNAFCDEAAKYGYTGMVYANKSMLNNNLVASKLDTVWLAHYTAQTDYTGDYDFWQFTSSGEVWGISGRVDLDFWFDDGGIQEPIPIEPEPEPVKLPFEDVPENAWSYDSILYVYENGIVQGVSDTEFCPKNNTRRCDFALMLYRMAGNPSVIGSTPFSDVSGYYKDAVTWAYQQGIINGKTGTTFAPNDHITREQLIKMLYGMAGSPKTGGSLSGYTDAARVSAYARDAMCWGVELNILQGADGRLNPRANATRQEVAAFLTRYMKIVIS